MVVAAQTLQRPKFRLPEALLFTIAPLESERLVRCVQRLTSLPGRPVPFREQAPLKRPTPYSGTQLSRS